VIDIPLPEPSVPGFAARIPEILDSVFFWAIWRAKLGLLYSASPS
jgi:hypothetical protein